MPALVFVLVTAHDKRENVVASGKGREIIFYVIVIEEATGTITSYLVFDVLSHYKLLSSIVQFLPTGRQHLGRNAKQTRLRASSSRSFRKGRMQMQRADWPGMHVGVNYFVLRPPENTWRCSGTCSYDMHQRPQNANERIFFPSLWVQNFI